MFRVKAILKKMKLRREIKIDSNKLVLPMFGKFLNRNLRAENTESYSNNRNLIILHCIRHAESVVNARNKNIRNLNLSELMMGKDPGIMDAPLSINGIENANEFAEKGGPIYKGKPIVERVSLIITSNLLRAIETSKIISKRASDNCKLCILDFVREKALYLSDIPSLSKKDVKIAYPNIDTSFLPDNVDKIILPESYDEVDKRIKMLLEFLKNYNNLENNEIILVSHYYFLRRLLKGSLLWQLPNLGVITIKINKDTGKIIECIRSS